MLGFLPTYPPFTNFLAHPSIFLLDLNWGDSVPQIKNLGTIIGSGRFGAISPRFHSAHRSNTPLVFFLGPNSKFWDQWDLSNCLQGTTYFCPVYWTDIPRICSPENKNILNPKMEVWFRWFSFSIGCVRFFVNHVNCQGWIRLHFLPNLYVKTTSFDQIRDPRWYYFLRLGIFA